MPDLIALLSNASQSLSGATGAVTTASHNMQNVNTPGYSRQRAILEASIPEQVVNGSYVGRGSRLVGVTQARDSFLESQVHYTFANQTRATTKASTLGSVHLFDSSQPGSVGDSLSALFDAIRLMSQNPADRALRAGTVNAAGALQTAFQQDARSISTARTALDEQISASVLEANDLAQKIASLNKQIVVSRMTAGSTPNDLMDKRQRAQDRLAELLGATPIKDQQGRVTLTLPQGGAIVAGERASRIELRPDGSNSGLLRPVIVDQDGGRLELRDNAFSGIMGGLLESRDGTLKAAVARLDGLAYDIAQAFNTAHTTGIDLNGAVGTDLFAVGSTREGAASRFELNTAIKSNNSLLATRGPTGGSGDNTGALEMLKLERTAISGSDSPVAAWAKLVGEFGADASAATANADHASALRTHLEKLRDGYSGVSIDEELVEMTKAQRAYEAIGKVIRTGDEMLQTLLSLKS